MLAMLVTPEIKEMLDHQEMQEPEVTLVVEVLVDLLPERMQALEVPGVMPCMEDQGHMREITPAPVVIKELLDLFQYQVVLIW